jgi:hypothetical protein
MIRVGPTTRQGLPAAISAWNEIGERARAAFLPGLGERDEAAPIALLAPTRWGPPSFDVIAQELRIALQDVRGRVVWLVLPHSSENRSTAAALEGFRPSTEARVLGRVDIHNAQLQLHPVSLIDSDRVISLGLERNGRAAATVTAQDADDTEADPEEFPAFVQSLDAGGSVLALAWAGLEAVTAAGVCAYRAWHELGTYAGRAEALGLQRAGQALRRVPQVASDTGLDRARSAARAVLEAAWVLRMSQAALAVEQATEAVS